jgi:hypothetical protein
MIKLQPRNLFKGVHMSVTVLQMDEVSCKNMLLKNLVIGRYRFRMPAHAFT